MRRKFISLFVLLSSVAIMLSSCQKKVESIFGLIPSIYENEMVELTKKAQSNAETTGSVVQFLIDKTDSVFAEAADKSQPEISNLIGMSIDATAEKDAGMELLSDIRIAGVTLLNVSQNLPLTVSVTFDAKSDAGMLYYVLEGENGVIDCGSIVCPALDENNVLHIETDIKAPNVPAKYQEACKSIRFVSSDYYSTQSEELKKLHETWRADYKKAMNL